MMTCRKLVLMGLDHHDLSCTFLTEMESGLVSFIKAHNTQHTFMRYAKGVGLNA